MLSIRVSLSLARETKSTRFRAGLAGHSAPPRTQPLFSTDLCGANPFLRLLSRGSWHHLCYAVFTSTSVHTPARHGQSEKQLVRQLDCHHLSLMFERAATISTNPDCRPRTYHCSERSCCTNQHTTTTTTDTTTIGTPCSSYAGVEPTGMNGLIDCSPSAAARSVLTCFFPRTHRPADEQARFALLKLTISSPPQRPRPSPAHIPSLRRHAARGSELHRKLIY